MNLNIPAAIAYVWYTLGLIWIVGLAFTKQNVRSQTGSARFLQLVLILLGLYLLAGSSPRGGWLGMRIVPAAREFAWAGLILTVLGCLWAIWARIVLGSNWSGRPTVKAGHELVVTGPYAITRHPIYSGLLLAAFGTGMAEGEARCLAGFILLFFGFAVKMGREEQLMIESFPEAYPGYRLRVRALIPGVF